VLAVGSGLAGKNDSPKAHRMILERRISWACRRRRRPAPLAAQRLVPIPAGILIRGIQLQGFVKLGDRFGTFAVSQQ